MGPTDNAPYPGDLCADLLANLLLLLELHGILVLTISKAGLDELKALICAELATLGLKIGLVPPALYRLEQFDNAVLETSAEHLDSILVLLNGMVIEDLSADYKQSVSSKSAWPRLTLLHDIIALRYKAIPNVDKGNSTISPDSYFSNEKLCSYLTFDIRIAEQDSLLKNLSYLNHDLDVLLSTAHQSISARFSQTKTSQEEEEEDDDDVVLAKQAQDYRQQISGLYKTLAKNMGGCGKEHVAQLCLSKLGVDRNILDIYISMCHESVDSETIAWHPTKCSKKELFGHTATSPIDGNLCRYLHTARAKRLPAALVYSDEILSEDSMEVCRLPQENLIWSFVDLATVLDEIPSETKPNGQINSANKLRLQCLLAQSILYLHPSLWMPETLKLSNIHFTVTKSARNLKNPYMYCAFQNVREEHVAIDIDIITDFMIHFGLLLLQIEMGRLLPLSLEEETSEYGCELALDRYIEQFDEDLNVHIKEVISSCLWFKKRCLEQIPNPKIPIDLRIRSALSRYILKPLIDSLEFNCPTVAREILSYTFEPYQQPQKVKLKRKGLAQKRKTDGDDDDNSQELSRLRTSKVNMIPTDTATQQNGLAYQLPSGKQVVEILVEQPTHPHTAPPNNTAVSTRFKDYTIGWICAIPIEKAVACEMLDEEYSRERWPSFDTQRDHNSYTFGRLHDHQIVIACLPKGRYGNTSASVVAQHMRTSFPTIRFVLIVGIAGGAPSRKHDIRLGDVVVSSPTPRHCGIIQYDYGKAIKDHDFEETGHMTPPPEILLNALASLEAQHKRRGHQLAKTVANMLARNKRLRSECMRPAEYTDQLYKASYKHDERDLCDCQSFDTASPFTDLSTRASVSSKKDSQDPIFVSRERRAPDQDDIVVHHGLIASANRLMKDAEARDVLVRKYDVLCFEMEAAGLVNSFPCVVVRGICDYSDSHKNDLWQGYAAANAAAYARELLEIIPCYHIDDTISIS